MGWGVGRDLDGGLGYEVAEAVASSVEEILVFNMVPVDGGIVKFQERLLVIVRCAVKESAFQAPGEAVFVLEGAASKRQKLWGLINDKAWRCGSESYLSVRLPQTSLPGADCLSQIVLGHLP